MSGRWLMWIVLLAPRLAAGAPPDLIDTARLTPTFSDHFETLRLFDPAARRGTWKTSYAFGAQSGRAAIESRTLPANGERQVYVDPGVTGTGARPLGLNPFSLSREGVGIHAGPTPPLLIGALWGYPFVSGLLTTEPSFSQTHGYFEIQAALPRQAGVWPAFWLLPVDGKGSAEIDVAEAIGSDTVYQSVHSGPEGRSKERQFETRVADVTRLHAYGVLWTAGTIAFYVDGRRTGVTPTPADLVGRPMYMLVDLAVGGRWPGPPDRAFRGADLRVRRIGAWSLTARLTRPEGGFRPDSSR